MHDLPHERPPSALAGPCLGRRVQNMRARTGHNFRAPQTGQTAPNGPLLRHYLLVVRSGFLRR